MNPIRWWRKRYYIIHELHERIDRMQDTVNNRNDLIRIQDGEITQLRRSVKQLELAVDDMEKLRNSTIARMDEIAKERDYWQGRAANP